MTGQAPDLLSLDINLSHEDGGDVCSALKEDTQTREIPVILMSGLMDLNKSVKCRADGYLMKPIG